MTGTKTDLSKTALWRMPPGLARYSSRDKGGDDWCAKQTYEWITEHAALLRSINDISGEHGTDIGHKTHRRGTDIDMYHFYLFPGANPTNGNSNYLALIARIHELPKQDSKNPKEKAVGVIAAAQVRAWIMASRDGIDSLAKLSTVEEIGYIRKGPESTGISGQIWGADLLQTGKIKVNGKVYDLGTGTWGNAKYRAWHNHHDHVHLTLAFTK